MFNLDIRPSGSPFAREIWHARSEDDGSFISVAASHWEMVITTHHDKRATVTVRGPETVATPMSYTAGGEWYGIRFKPGVLIPLLRMRDLVDRSVNLPPAGSRSFWLHGAAWPIPEYEHADAFIDRLERDGLLVRDPVVEEALLGHPPVVSVRSVQRRFAQTTGLTLSTVRQIDRARHAMTLLQQGRSILDTVFEAGYYDQAHLTRAMNRWLGQTPARIVGTPEESRMSLSYKTVAP